MGFFNSVGGFFKKVGKGISKGATSVFDKVIKPAGKWTVGAAKDVYTEGKSIVKSSVHEAEKLADKGLEAQKGLFGGLGNILSSPVVVLGAAAVAVFLISQSKSR